MIVCVQEAIVVIMDVGPTMHKQLGTAAGEKQQSRFEVAIESVKMLIEQKVISSKYLKTFKQLLYA